VNTGSLHELRPDAFEYTWDNSVEPALEVEPGETVLLRVRDASDEQLGPSSTAADVGALDFGKVNPVSGPVYVKGAQPGDTLTVEVLEFETPTWGWTAIIPGFGVLADEFPDPWLRISEVTENGVRFSDRITLPFRPFPGTLGVAPPEPGAHSIVPPSRWGGNMDTKYLNPGTTLYLPVGVEGALFSLGDTHAAQGDGEVCGTAIESQMDVELTLDLFKGARLKSPRFTTEGPVTRHLDGAGYEVTTGVGPDLMTGARESVMRMIDLLSADHGLNPIDAYLLLSVCGDLRVSEIVDMPNWVVSFYFPRIVFS
jgi:acetamidase/formamidase